MAQTDINHIDIVAVPCAPPEVLLYRRQGDKDIAGKGYISGYILVNTPHSNIVAFIHAESLSDRIFTAKQFLCLALRKEGITRLCQLPGITVQYLNAHRPEIESIAKKHFRLFQLLVGYV